MTTWPSASKASTSNLDSGSDKPRLARADIKQNVDNVNDIIDMFNIDSPLDKQILAYDSGTAKFVLTQSINSQGITIDDNNISASRSNDDINLQASGTGMVTTKSILNIDSTYKEKVNSLTSDNNITVNCDIASIHKVTLAHNANFVITNLSEGQSVTITIKQDATGNRTGSFSTEDSATIGFPYGLSTLTTAGGGIDMVNIFNDGTHILGTLAKSFST